MMMMMMMMMTLILSLSLSLSLTLILSCHDKGTSIPVHAQDSSVCQSTIGEEGIMMAW